VDVIREADDGNMEVLARRAPCNAHVVAAENVTCLVFSSVAPSAFHSRGEKAHLGHLATDRQDDERLHGRQCALTWACIYRKKCR
jgi:hypothetical protein